MPRMDGLEALIRIHESAPNTAVVMLSGFASEADLRAVIAAGARGCVEKGAPNVLERIEALLTEPMDVHGAPAR